MNLADYSYVMEIHPAREKQEDYEGVTSNLIIEELENGEIINIDEASKLSKHKGSVILFMSPNDISKIENELEEIIKNNNE